MMIQSWFLLLKTEIKYTLGDQHPTLAHQRKTKKKIDQEIHFKWYSLQFSYLNYSTWCSNHCFSEVKAYLVLHSSAFHLFLFQGQHDLVSLLLKHNCLLLQ